MGRVKRRALLPLVALIALVVAQASAPAAGLSPTPDELMGHVAALTAPEMEGRASGSSGGDRAARYIADRLAALRLAPGGEGGTFLQPFAVGVSARVGSGSALERLGPDPAAIE